MSLQKSEPKEFLNLFGQAMTECDYCCDLEKTEATTPELRTMVDMIEVHGI